MMDSRSFSVPRRQILGCRQLRRNASELPYERSTISTPTLVHSRDPGLVPFIQLDPSSDHPLVREQGMGITLHRLAEINQLVIGVDVP